MTTDHAEKDLRDDPPIPIFRMHKSGGWDTDLAACLVGVDVCLASGALSFLAFKLKTISIIRL